MAIVPAGSAVVPGRNNNDSSTTKDGNDGAAADNAATKGGDETMLITSKMHGKNLPDQRNTPLSSYCTCRDTLSAAVACVVARSAAIEPYS